MDIEMLFIVLYFQTMLHNLVLYYHSCVVISAASSCPIQDNTIVVMRVNSLLY